MSDYYSAIEWQTTNCDYQCDWNGSVYLTDAHGLKIQGEGIGPFFLMECPIVWGFREKWVPLFGVYYFLLISFF